MDSNRRAFLGLAADAPASPAREAIRKRYFPDVVLQGHDGKTYRFYDDLIKDKVVVLNFMYLNCEDGSCPITTHALAQVQKLLRSRVGKDIFFYSITLDPERDSVAALKKYTRAHGIRPGWLFLRASAEDTYRLRRNLGYYNRVPELDALKSTHAGMIRYGNEARQQWAAISSFAAPRVIARAVQWVAPGKAAPKGKGAPHAHHHA